MMRARDLPAQPADIRPEDIWAMLSRSQRKILAACPPAGRAQRASEIGAHGRTLMSMNDLWRGARDILPPIMLVSWDREIETGHRLWHRTTLGDRVIEAVR